MYYYLDFVLIVAYVSTCLQPICRMVGWHDTTFRRVTPRQTRVMRLLAFDQLRSGMQMQAITKREHRLRKSIPTNLLRARAPPRPLASRKIIYLHRRTWVSSSNLAKHTARRVAPDPAAGNGDIGRRGNYCSIVAPLLAMAQGCRCQCHHRQRWRCYYTC